LGAYCGCVVKQQVPGMHRVPGSNCLWAETIVTEVCFENARVTPLHLDWYVAYGFAYGSAVLEAAFINPDDPTKFETFNPSTFLLIQPGEGTCCDPTNNSTTPVDCADYRFFNTFTVNGPVCIRYR
ncbi:MAG: hypothetical protein ACK5U7_07490, partial [Bacteroidota bacterium]